MAVEVRPTGSVASAFRYRLTEAMRGPRTCMGGKPTALLFTEAVPETWIYFKLANGLPSCCDIVSAA